MNQPLLPDTRPYPTDPVKNELLMYAGQIADSSSVAQKKLAAENLAANLNMMLSQNHYLGLSVAMSMAPSPAVYQALLESLNTALSAENNESIQWFALPVILVLGSNSAHTLTPNTPVDALKNCFAKYPHLQALTQAEWLPGLMRAADLAAVNAGQWYTAKQSKEAAAALAATLPQHPIQFDGGQAVEVAFAVGYGSPAIQSVLGKNLQDAALPLMQVWQEALSQPGLTLFANPLNAASPLHAITDAAHMRLRMALDVFAANAIRAIRLQSPRVGVVMAAQQGGRLLFGFNATDSQFELQPQVFSWPLSPLDNIAIIQQNFLDLMVECQVENIRLLTDPIHENEELPSYATALKYEGCNPLFADVEAV